MIYQTNKIRNFVFCQERFISSREINPFSRNSFFLTTGDPRHRWDEMHVNASDTEAAFLDLHLSNSNDIVSTKIYDKRDDFDFEMSISHF